MWRRVLLLQCVFSIAAFAEIGRLAVIDGVALRSPKGKDRGPCKLGEEIELGDKLEVESGNVKLELRDGSVVMLSAGSTLEITGAAFNDLDRSTFSAFLKIGSLWASVKKALGGGTFEVRTERAVAGVRGTIFRIDADTLVKAASGSDQKKRVASTVRVVEGTVKVSPTTRTAASLRALAKAKAKAAKGRVQVSGPKEISRDEWETKFALLQKNQQVIVGDDIWEQAEFDATVAKDSFAEWIEKHQ